MGAMNLVEYRADIRTELSDSGTFFSDAEIDRGVEKTEALLARLIPKKNIVEATVTIDRTNETITISSQTGTTTYKPIKYDSETVTSKPVGTDYTRDTHYTINYMTGVVTAVSAGVFPDTDYLIAYKQDPMRLDISSLITDPIKIPRIEYPVGEQPPTFLTGFDIIEGFIIFHKDTTLTEGKHIRIYYDSKWTGAAAATDGDYPAHLDDAIVIGASGQTLIFKAEKYVQSSVTELALVNAAADSMATPLAAIGTALDRVEGKVIDAITALDKVPVYLETSDTTDNAKDILANITDDTAALRTRIDAILSMSNDFLFSAATDPSAKYYLTQGDDYINKLNTGDRVAEKFADYARASTQIFTGLIQEATVRLSDLRSYIEEAQAWMRMGDTFNEEAVQRLGVATAFINEANQRIAEVNAWAVQADRYRVTSQEYLNIAGRYLASGQSKINEFYVMLGFKPELQHTQAATSQATKY